MSGRASRFFFANILSFLFCFFCFCYHYHYTFVLYIAVNSLLGLRCYMSVMSPHWFTASVPFFFSASLFSCSLQFPTLFWKHMERIGGKQNKGGCGVVGRYIGLAKEQQMALSTKMINQTIELKILAVDRLYTEKTSILIERLLFVWAEMSLANEIIAHTVHHCLSFSFSFFFLFNLIIFRNSDPELKPSVR